MEEALPLQVEGAQVRRLEVQEASDRRKGKGAGQVGSSSWLPGHELEGL